MIAVSAYPKRLTINGKRWRVRFASKIDPQAEGRITVGYCDAAALEIVILKGQPLDDILETFIHEVLHAIEASYGVKIPHKIIYGLDRPITEFVITNLLKRRRR